jgi:hypothetical protein
MTSFIDVPTSGYQIVVDEDFPVTLHVVADMLDPGQTRLMLSVEDPDLVLDALFNVGKG